MASTREWTGIKQFPSPTQVSLSSLLNQLREKGIGEVTVLLLGKGGMGKSSSVNSLLGERVCPVTAFQAERDVPILVSRSTAGFTLNVIDTPGLAEGGELDRTNLDRIASFCVNKAIDVVLYVDRLDGFSVDSLDGQIIRGITEKFGRKVWDISAVLLTHAHVQFPSDGSTYDDFVAARSQEFQAAIKKEGKASKNLNVPVLLIENNSRVPSNEEGESVLPNGDVFLVKLVEGMVSVISNSSPPVTLTKESIEGPNHGWKFKLLIPLLALAQFHYIWKPMFGIGSDEYERQLIPRKYYQTIAEDQMQNGTQSGINYRIEKYREHARRNKKK